MSGIHDPITKGGVCLTRRRFVQGLAMGGAFASMGLGGSVLAAAMKQQGPQTLRGTNFNLTIGVRIPTQDDHPFRLIVTARSDGT